MWNDPYPSTESSANTYYGSFAERPKHLDPARAYSADEYAFLAQIYEPPLQYHFLLRPYRLVPLIAAEVPQPLYLDASGNPLPEDTPPEAIAYSDYLIRIQPGVYFQPHPALAQDQGDRYRYHDLRPQDLRAIHRLADFAEMGTRELVAEDLAYQVKRLAAPWNHSPIAALMGQHIQGFAELADRLGGLLSAPPLEQAHALHQAHLSGVEVVDRYRLRIRIQGTYPQFIYWLAMPFFAPIPWEADVFYAQPGLAERNISLDWYPIGTGPYMLVENDPNRRMVLERNPNFHGERYPTQGMPGDEERGLLRDAGKTLPFIDRAVYSLEKEDIPRWTKFLQGYYDVSGIGSDTFDQAIQIDTLGLPILTESLRSRGIRLLTAVDPSIYYLGFNMLDPVIGGESERTRLLRRAISIAVDFDEFIAIFANGRGIPAQGPLPPGIFGHREGETGINPFVYVWHDGRPQRRRIDEARALMREAGYPDGIDPATGRALTLYYEAVATGPDDRARLNWIRKQFAKIGIELVIRATDYNRFQEKIRSGTGQVFMWGWNADYPDPENFLFLLYGPNGKVEHQGENAANYRNPEFDRLFERMKDLTDGPERQAIIERMVAIVRTDAPWSFGFHPRSFTLHHRWLYNAYPNQMANNTLKYLRLDPEDRKSARLAWNQPVLWPLALIGGVLLLLVIPAWVAVRRRERASAL
ncbi:ABC transporter substrate-binding protein [Caldichromatium japonicum]|uniref:ABC transporter substrate-binding protein n=1 Tax=Caldichromatium japonicum TaxID=2699430 RepID=UPI001FE8CD3E|nr:ABC transporter substrate-binding protein [Caldichromatium japonicum]